VEERLYQLVEIVREFPGLSGSDVAQKFGLANELTLRFLIALAKLDVLKKPSGNEKSWIGWQCGLNAPNSKESMANWYKENNEVFNKLLKY
jgi:hypothetical protein